MSNNVRPVPGPARTGDTAVDGLLGGIVGGAGMAVYLVVGALLDGTAAAVPLGRFDPAQSGDWLRGLAAHLAVAGIYGVLFALAFAALLRLRPALRRYGWLAGLLYGLLLFAFAHGILFAAWPSDMVQFATAQLFVGHLVYGLLLGLEVSRR